MTRYLLDTNTVSHLLRLHPAVRGRVQQTAMASLSISVVTEAELLFGLARRPEAHRLHQAVKEFLRRVEIVPWDSAAAACYGTARADLEKRGKVLAPLDLLIGCHALCRQRVMVSSDQAFRHLDGLALEDWTV